VSLDAKQSITAWLSVIAFALIFWLLLRSHVADGLPSWVVQTGQGLVVASLLFRLVAWLWRRRSVTEATNG
jgi:protein-S-isoprenylcysteine O-methyltransferase Ste14